MTRHLPLVTNSEIKTFRRCAREWHYSYVLGYRPRSAGAALRLGTYVHAGLEAWWDCRKIGATLRNTGEIALALGDHGRDIGRELDPFERERGLEMLAGYMARWDDEPIEVLAVEQEFRLPLVNPRTGRASHTYQLGGKLDAVAQLEGKVYLVEHKTTSEDCGPGSDYARRLRIDGQVSLYYAAVRALGWEPAGVLYDVLRKPGLRPLKTGKTRRQDESPEEFGARCAESLTADHYQRFEVTRLESEEMSAALDVWLTTQQMRESQLQGSYPRNPDSCIRFGATCSFFAVCTGEEALETSSRFRLATRKHEELAPEPAEENAA